MEEGATRTKLLEGQTKVSKQTNTRLSRRISSLLCDYRLGAKALIMCMMDSPGLPPVSDQGHLNRDWVNPEEAAAIK